MKRKYDLAQLFCFHVCLVWLVLGDDFHNLEMVFNDFFDVEDGHPLLVVLRVEDLVEPGVPLLLVEELDQLGGGDSVCLADRLEHVVDVCSRADGLVDLVEHLTSEKSVIPET